MSTKITTFLHKSITDPSGRKGYVVWSPNGINFQNASSFAADFRYFSLSGPRVPFIPRSITIDNSNNANSVSVIVDDEIQYPHVAQPGQIRTFQIPYSTEPGSIVFTSTQASVSTVVPVYFFDTVMTPDSTGQTGSAVTVENTVPVIISSSDATLDVSITGQTGSLSVVQGTPTNPLPFNTITAAGSTSLLAVNKVIKSIQLWAAGGTIQGVAGLNLIQFLDGAKNIANFQPSIPAAALSSLAFELGTVHFPDGGYQMTGGDLYINLQTALTGGALYGNIVTY